MVDAGEGSPRVEAAELRMSLDSMLAAGYATVEAMARRLDDPAGDPVLRRTTPAELRPRLAIDAPEDPTAFDEVLRTVLDDVLPFASRTDHPGYFAFIPSFTTWPAAMADLLAAAANPYCGAWMEAAGPTQIELDVLGWFRDWLGMPSTTSGVLVSGGSAANLTALMVMRTAQQSNGPDRAGPDSAGLGVEDGVIYVSDQAHSSVARTARVLGFADHQLRLLPTDHLHRMTAGHLAAAIASDRAAGRTPMAVCASAGSTNSGAIDPLVELADVCEANRVWLHVDAAYGGFSALSARGRLALAGIERANSVTVDPHKWLFQPMECGGVLIRDGSLLERTFGVHADYLDEARTHDSAEVDFSDRGLQLSRGFRALKIWMSVQTFGLRAFRDAVDRGLDLAQAAERMIVESPDLELMSPAQLGIVCFRRAWPDEPDLAEEGVVARNLDLVTALERSGRALVSTTRLHGRFAVRICVLNPTSGLDDVRAVVDFFASGAVTAVPVVPAPRVVPDAAAAVDPTAPAGAISTVLAGLPIFANLDPAALGWLAESGAVVDLPGDAVVIEQWGTDRFFSVILHGTVVVTVDGRVVRELGPTDFFGELAAQDWGAGYGYMRLATVTATSPLRLFTLPGRAFAELLRRSPEVQRHVDAATRERLREV